MVGQTIKESAVINGGLKSRYLNLSTSVTVDEIGKNPIVKVGRYIRLLWKVLWSLVTFHPDICYLTINSGGLGFYKDFTLVFLVGLFGVKRVYHYHNKGISKYQHRWLDSLLYRLVFRKAEVILLSKYLYPDIKKYVPESRVHYCANGIGAEGVISCKSRVASQDSQLTISKNKFVEVLFLSNLIESKGVFVLLEACRILKSKQLPFQCTLVGGEGDITEAQLNEAIRNLGIEDCVLYAGRKYGADKDTYFESADIFVHPTLNDCMPMVLIEAMQHRLPIVATPEGAIPAMVEEGVTGFMVPQQDAPALAAKLEQLIQNPELRQQMGAAGHAKYQKEFTLEIFERRMKDILESIAGK